MSRDGLALSEATLDIILCRAVLTQADQHDRVERPVELSISKPVRKIWMKSQHAVRDINPGPSDVAARL
jgi:hypothetical protein